nr:phospholipase-like protein [Tanacetum cinerariifolium]
MVFRIIDDELFDRLHEDDVVSLCCLGILQLVLLGVEGKRRILNWILRLENDRVGWDNYPWGSYVWPTLYSQLKNANVRRWPKLYATQPTTEIDKKLYSIFGYTWAFKGNLPTARLTPDGTEARSDWWISSRSYFDGGWFLVIPETSKQQLLLQYRYANELVNRKAVATWFIKLANPNVVATSSIKLEKTDAGTNILIQGKRERRPSFYKRSPYTEQPPSTVLPKKHGNKTKINVKKSNLSPLNLGNALDDDNEGGDDVIFLGGQLIGNYLVYENVNVSKKQLGLHLCMPDFDSNTPVGWLSGEYINSWMELLIRNRPNNAP